jgi:hypothetical protein
MDFTPSPHVERIPHGVPFWLEKNLPQGWRGAHYFDGRSCGASVKWTRRAEPSPPGFIARDYNIRLRT